MNLQPVFKPHHSGPILAYRIISPLRFCPLIIVCVLTKKETLILNTCCLLFGFSFASRCLANFYALTSFSLYYCEEWLDIKDYNYYNHSRIKKQYYACFSLVFHFLLFLNWPLKKKSSSLISPLLNSLNALWSCWAGQSALWWSPALGDSEQQLPFIQSLAWRSPWVLCQLTLSGTQDYPYFDLPGEMDSSLGPIRIITYASHQGWSLLLFLDLKVTEVLRKAGLYSWVKCVH